MTYEEYLTKITETLKIRSVNYRLTQNDIIYMSNNVYSEIAMRVNWDPVEQAVVMSENVDEYDLDALYTVVGNQCLLDTYKIEDDNSVSVGKFFRKVKNHTFKVKDELSGVFYDRYNEKTITFFRTQLPDIVELSGTVQLLLFEAIINGILYHTHSSIPSPTASNVPFNETGMYKQLYDKAVSDLINRFPQR